MTREETIQVLKEISATLKSCNGFTEYPQAIDMAIEALQEPNIMDYLNIWKIPKACRSCSNHPSNGGSGICHCTLGNNIRW